MTMRILLFVAVLSFFWAGLVHADDVFFSPENPTTEDVISVIAQFSAGPFVETQSHSIEGNKINVLFVQDGLDFSPNPPHEAIEVIGLLPAGQYTVHALLREGGFERTITLNMAVAPAHAVPTGNMRGMVLLVALTFLIGVVAIRARTQVGLAPLGRSF